MSKVRINQVRTYVIQLNEKEVIPYDLPKGLNADKGYVDRLIVKLVSGGVLMLVFEGHYFDFFDLEPIPDQEDQVRPKRKPLHVEVRVDQLREDDPLRKFLDKLTIVREDEMTMAQFLALEEPVG